MKDFLEAWCEVVVTAIAALAVGSMICSPTLIVVYFAYEKQSWLLGVLAFVVFIESIGVAMMIYERIDK